MLKLVKKNSLFFFFFSQLSGGTSLVLLVRERNIFFLNSFLQSISLEKGEDKLEIL